jgi:metal-dependent amidase/aminoacylase/carboxypeptidase family protein
MLNQGEFDGIDVVISGHASTKTYESGSSLGCAQLDISFKAKKNLSTQEMQNTINTQNPSLLLFNLTELYKASYPLKGIITGVMENKLSCDSLIPLETICRFKIKATDKGFIEYTKTKLIESAKFSARFYDCNIKYNQIESSFIPLKTNSELSKLASHNLKECGIINIHAPVIHTEGLDLGNVSVKIPTINPGIGICKKETNFTIEEFNKTAKSSYAKENLIKAACALALTGVDVIQKTEALEINDEQ